MSESLSKSSSHEGVVPTSSWHEKNSENIAASAPQVLPAKDNYRLFADQIALNHRDLHARITYPIHWLYGETKQPR
jgi:hypothetical protein